MHRSYLLVGVFFLAASPVLAQSAPAAAPPKHLTQLFISPMGEPFRAAKEDPYPSAAWFKAADTNGDGVVDKAEFMADAERFFKALDTDRDGVLNEAEISAYETKVAPEVNIGTNAPDAPVHVDALADYRGADGSPPEVRVDSMTHIQNSHVHDAERARNMLAARRGAGIFGFIDEPEPVRADDTNIDFRVSHTEWIAAAAKRFSTLDLKHEGKLTLAGLPKTPYQQVLETRK